MRICIVSPPIIKSGIIPLSNLIDILLHFSENIWVITGKDFTTKNYVNNKVNIWSTEYNYDFSGLKKIISYFLMQFKYSIQMIKLRNDIDCFLFFGNHLVIPIITSKILNKKSILNRTGSSSKLSIYQHSHFSKFVSAFEKIGCILCNEIIVYSPNLIQEWGLNRYRNKIFITHRHIVDLNSFRCTSNFAKRELIIGYVGRLSEEKGVLNFLQSIPLLVETNDKLSFAIAGSGKLGKNISDFIEKNGLENKVSFVGWISHEELPSYLNTLKLVVLPSYTEGLPNILLESMACRTPVLATSVGSIPDVIINEKNGFLMENNSPTCIAKNIIKIIEHPNLDIISKNSREFIEVNFRHEIIVENYGQALKTIDK